ncbi:hypothetical protein [Acetobacter sp.]|uniref:hypothetical protein n=1 Tax=Acetobacter sp. TaxID=440 RepID=UPI0025C72BB1|nr:hypothetical protein [Acetobacter sp.]MCH4090531.1 hypothetical protein [Acetobacter sp.]MCI1299225.1 hypothetical protein [Acetobacter sp.]MCI1315772.1 hypothetical protein [Acetobacter sp.]
MARWTRILLFVMLAIDVCAFIPSFLGPAGAAFLWDDPTVKIASWAGVLRVPLTFLFMGAPLYVGGNFVLASVALKNQRSINSVLWVSFLPSLMILGGIGYFAGSELQDTIETHRVERSYEAIVASPQMTRFHTLTKDLSPYVRLTLALRAQQRLKEQGISPPATVDELYADEYRVMLSLAEALKRGAISKSEYDLQHGLATEDYLEISTKLGKPHTFPEDKFFQLPD